MDDEEVKEKEIETEKGIYSNDHNIRAITTEFLWKVCY